MRPQALSRVRQNSENGQKKGCRAILLIQCGFYSLTSLDSTSFVHVTATALVKTSTALKWTPYHGLPVGLSAWIQQIVISSKCKSGHSDLLHFLVWPARPCHGLGPSGSNSQKLVSQGAFRRYLEVAVAIPLGQAVGIQCLCSNHLLMQIHMPNTQWGQANWSIRVWSISSEDEMAQQHHQLSGHEFA